MANMEDQGTQAPRLAINPDDNIIIGSQAIMRYLGLRSIVSMYQWHEVYGLPIVKRPDGQWMTSMTAIDEWIFVASELDMEKRPHSRGSNVRYDRALEMAQWRAVRAQMVSGALKDGPILTKHGDRDLQPRQEDSDDGSRK